MNEEVRNGSMEKFVGQLRRASYNDVNTAEEINPKAKREKGTIQ